MKFGKGSHEESGIVESAGGATRRGRHSTALCPGRQKSAAAHESAARGFARPRSTHRRRANGVSRVSRPKRSQRRSPLRTMRPALAGPASAGAPDARARNGA
ncbi:aromatic ring-opening dioxygenase LigA [Burkholderia pseudomallei]|uniref:aromatic ring-opening dioxygenase LigA n=1 Tax=Burkholderia pseudomallei TaxID=28450 RepID=UPI000ADE7B05|nr:aromatic ring-opening dioxygenase LigA [Burkholderia pseudomallei]QTB56868.1 aromatic ring-opening dioxygenase LigA [Burkholderia pseudomallei]